MHSGISSCVEFNFSVQKSVAPAGNNEPSRAEIPRSAALDVEIGRLGGKQIKSNPNSGEDSQEEIVANNNAGST